MGNLIPEKLKLIDFAILEGELHNPHDLIPEHVEGHSFKLGFEIGFNAEEKLSKAEFEIEFNSESKKGSPKAKGYYRFAFVFLVENMDELLEADENNQISYDAMLGNAIASIVYSTSRGILMSRFQGTVFADFILPVIDPNQLLDMKQLRKVKNE